MLNRLGSQVQNPYLLMDRAYEGNETRQLALALGFTPVVPPLSTRSLSEKQYSKRYASLVECKDINNSTTKSRLL